MVFEKSPKIKFVISEKYRKDYIVNSIEDYLDESYDNSWISGLEKQNLKEDLKKFNNQSNPYLIDLFAQGSLKLVDWFLIPPVLTYCLAKNYVDLKTYSALMVMGGSITRTIYSSLRIGFDLFKPKEKRVDRKIAFKMGIIPNYGNFAYLNQMVSSSLKENKNLGNFIKKYYLEKTKDKLNLSSINRKRLDVAINYLCNKQNYFSLKYFEYSPNFF